jgi:hypothetical protein
MLQACFCALFLSHASIDMLMFFNCANANGSAPAVASQSLGPFVTMVCGSDGQVTVGIAVDGSTADSGFMAPAHSLTGMQCQ